MDVPFEIEIALEEAAHAKGLEDFGVHRIELCANLAEGGLTPTRGQAKAVVRETSLPIYAMLRPRAGDFCYTSSEQQQLLDDLEHLATSGIQGIVFGALLESGSLDLALTTKVVARAHGFGLGVTFHRAIDAANSPLLVLEQLQALGVERILTSGGAPKALQGQELIAALCEEATLSIQAGSGVSAEVVIPLWKVGVRAFHMTAREWVSPVDDPLGFKGHWRRNNQKIQALYWALEELATGA
ncbi:MAG: copper homeostasis protein CutC [Schleiferiaceae bacterium]